MSITITITAETPRQAILDLKDLLGDNVPTPVVLAADTAALAKSFEQQQTKAAEPSPEPEIVPPKRTRAPKKAETVVQPDVTDIDKNGDPVDPYAALTAEEKGDLLRKVMVAVMDAKGEDRVIALLGEHKVKNRSEAIASADFAKIVAAFEAEVA